MSSMLLLDPSKRITAAAAKLHPWLVANCIHANENVRRMRSVIKNAIERQRRLEEMGLGRDDEEDSELETRDKHPSSASSSAAYVFDARLRRASVISTTGNSTFSSSNPGLSSTSSSSASSYNPSSSSPLRKSSSIFNTSNPNSLIYNNPRSVKDIQDALARLDVSSERRRSMVVVAAQQQLETLPESSSASSTHILLDVNTCIPSAPVAAAAAAAMANTNSDHISPLVSSPIIQKRGSIENLAPCWNYNQRTRHLSFKTAVGAVKAANRFSTT